MSTSPQKITPCLWFDANCEEAVAFYTDVFPNSQITHLQRYPEGMDGPMAAMAGKVLTAVFELDGYAFQALDGGPQFTLNPSISLMLNFDPSVDPDARGNLETLWAHLSEGGQTLMELGEYPWSPLYGWTQDRFGVSWQLILSDAEGEPRPFIMPAMLFVGDVCGKAAEALRTYVDLFADSRLGMIVNYPPGMEPESADSTMFGEACLAGQWFTAMDSAADHKFGFNEAFSLSIECETQEEVDHFFDALSAVPEAEQCGWLKDRFGLSWQVVPRQLGEFMTDPDPERTGRVMNAFMSMKKFDIAALQAAYDGG